MAMDLKENPALLMCLELLYTIMLADDYVDVVDYKVDDTDTSAQQRHGRVELPGHQVFGTIRTSLALFL